MGADERARRLRRLFEAAEYTVQERPEGLVAARGRDHRVVVILASVRTPHDVEDAFPADAIHRAIVYPSEPGPVARSLAAERSIEILVPTTLGGALDELLLGGLDGAGPGASESEPPLEPPTVVVPQGDRYVRPRIDREEAVRIIRDPALRASLRYVPYFVAPYRVRAPAPHDGTRRTSEHLLAVHTLRRRAEAWDASAFALGEPPDVPLARLDPEIDAGEALAIAIEWIREHHTIRVDHTEQHGGTVVVETRRISPRPDDIRVGPFALIFLPVWYCEGPRGRVLLNAVTGEPERVRPEPPDEGGLPPEA